MVSAIKNATIKLQQMKNGKKCITNDIEMDLMSEIDDETMNDVKSLPNPNRCGLLDQYIAWI